MLIKTFHVRMSEKSKFYFIGKSVNTELTVGLTNVGLSPSYSKTKTLNVITDNNAEFRGQGLVQWE